LDNIRKDIGDSYIWATVDESTDSLGRYVANILVGKLSSLGYSAPHLVSTKVLEKTNHETVSRFVNNSLRLLFRGTENYEDRLLLLVSDAAPYMVKAGKTLKPFFPNMIHLTCLAHGIQRAAELVRSSFKFVDMLIAETKKVFLKAPYRVQVYQELNPDLPLPPQPVVTRWGTWIEAAIFFSQNFDSIKQVIDKLPADAISVTKAKKLFAKPIVKRHLAYIEANLSNIPPAIEKLETCGLPLTESLEVVQTLSDQLASAPGKTAKKIAKQFEVVKGKNQGLTVVKEIALVLSGENPQDAGIVQDISPNIMAQFKYAPITSCDVERSFSVFKSILTNRRLSFTPENLEMYLVVNCGAKSLT